MRFLPVALFLAALLGSALAQSPSPAASAAASPSAAACDIRVLNGTDPFDIFLLGISSSPSPAASPAASSAPTMNLTNSLIGGSAAVNGDALLFDSLVGSGLNCSASLSASPAPAAANATLLVTGSINSSNSQISCHTGFLQVGSNITRTPNFAAVGAQLLNESSGLCLSGSAIRGNITNGVLALTLPSTSQLTIINLNASDLGNLRLITINASSNASSAGATPNSFLVLNVLGTSSANASAANSTSANSTASANAVVLTNFGMSLNGVNSSQILWNFCNATNVVVNLVRIMGSILAPRAQVTLNNAGLAGSLVALSLQSTFTSQTSSPFGGFFCPANSTAAV